MNYYKVCCLFLQHRRPVKITTKQYSRPSIMVEKRYSQSNIIWWWVACFVNIDDCGHTGMVRAKCSTHTCTHTHTPTHTHTFVCMTQKITLMLQVLLCNVTYSMYEIMPPRWLAISTPAYCPRTWMIITDAVDLLLKNYTTYHFGVCLFTHVIMNFNMSCAV